MMLPRFSCPLTLLLLLFTASLSTSSTGPHIADVNILLPPKMTHPVEYRLQGSDGCFKWSWDHHDVLAVLPEYNFSSHCSTSARLKSIAPYTGRKETAVYATDVHTGMVIRCKVYIDVFTRIQIFHNSVKLDLDGLATLRIRAFDSEENVFSSLVGIQFAWQLMPETDGLPHHLVHVPLKDSPLSDCGGLCGDLDVQITLEDSGVFSDLYVVKGAEIGHEIVAVHLAEPSFEHMSDKIVLTVAEAISLDPPSPVFVLIGAAINYTLKVIRGNVPQVVALPSPFYRWSVLNSSVAQVDHMLGEAHALNLGITTIAVEDTRVAGHTQLSSLHVVLPDTLLLFILPLSLSGDPIEGTEPLPSATRWYLVSGRQYLIEMKVFSQGPSAHEIYITDSDEIKLHTDQSEFWNILPISDDNLKQKSRILKAASYGLGKLTASLTYWSGHEETREVLKVVQEVMVCNQVGFKIDTGSNSSSRILLPWAPSIYQELELKATGGCAMKPTDYKWFSSDMSIVSVSASGVVQAKSPGRAIIKAVSVYDPLNYDEVAVEVSPPSSMFVLPNFPVETLVGSQLRASVTFKAADDAYFYRCDAFRSFIRWKTESEYFSIVNTSADSFISNKKEIIELSTSPSGPPCAWTYIYASNSGHTTLHATLTSEYHHQVDNHISGSIVLKASARIAAYLPLNVHQATEGNQFGGYWTDLTHSETHKQFTNLDYLYLVPGTCLDVMLHGGPERWNEDTEFVETVEALDEKSSLSKNGVLVHQTYATYGQLYRIECKNLGNFGLIFKRGNLIGKDHPFPTVSETKLTVTCSFPSSVSILADEDVNAPEAIKSASQADRSSDGVRTSPVTVTNGRTIRVSAVGVSGSGKAFANSSSLGLRWELHDCDGLASWDEACNSRATKSSWERFLALRNASGLCTIRATVVGFINSLSGQYSSPETVITDAVRLQLVSSLTVKPDFSLLFFNPDARLNLSISGGSCFLDTLVNDTQIVKVIKPSSGLQCSQLVLAPKGLGTALVTVRDIGLVPPLAASSVVQVSDMDWIKIMPEEEISIMEGSLQSISLLAGITCGSTFDPSQYSYMNVRVHVEDHIVELVDDNNFPSHTDGYVNAPNFTVRATRLGFTTLYVSARQHSGHEILSQPIKVEVYAPPVIHPSTIFLVPGASYVLTVRGGPTVGAYVEYASTNYETAIVHKSSGRLSAIAPGNSSLVATFYRGRDVICRAYGKIEVEIPSSARLSVQSEQLAVGGQMPIFPSLTKGNLFSFYELCKNYKWTVDDEEVLSFQIANGSEDDGDGIPTEARDKLRYANHVEDQGVGFIQVLYGRSGGKANVAISFSCNFTSSKSFSHSRSYSTSISLWVVPDLPLALGLPVTWIFPPHYTSSDLLPSTPKSVSKKDALNRKDTITYALLTKCGERLQEAPDRCMSIDAGKIKTKGSEDLACIQANDKSTGRTEVAACVRVAEVAQARIAAEDFPMYMLAVGAELDLPIKYHDILGNPFREAHNVVLYEAETNFPDVVSIDDTCHGNGHIHLRAINHGRALVRVGFINNPRKSDYVMVSVGAHLYPQNPILHVGNQLNFSLEGLDDKISGLWLSGNSSVLSVDILSGKAEATREGTTQVIFESSNMKLHTHVTVLAGNILSVDAPKEMLTNAPFPSKGYRFAVKKYGDVHNQNNRPAGAGMVFLFDCRVDPPYIGYAKPWRDLNSDNSFCLFFPYSPEHLVHSAPYSKDTRHGVSISISASLRGDGRVSGSASARFVGGFTILEMDKNSLHLNLSPASSKSIITVVGNTDVEFLWHEKARISVRRVHDHDTGLVGHAEFEVKADGAKKFKDKLVITLPSTGQTAEVDVSYEPEDRSASPTSFFTLWAGVVGCFTMLILIVTVSICYLDRPDRSQQSAVTPGTPSSAAPSTPDFRTRSPAVTTDQAPRTPSPFLDYVRRTIDETPYYRQDFRRRTNPQNTY